MWLIFLGIAGLVGFTWYEKKIKAGDTVFFPLSSAQAQVTALGLTSPQDATVGMVVQSVSNGQITGMVVSLQALPGAPNAGTIVSINPPVGPVTIAQVSITGHVSK